MQHASSVTHLHKIAGGQSPVSGREAKPKLLGQLREALRSRHYSRRTEPRLRNTVLQPPGIDDTLKIIKHAPPHLKRYILLSWYLGLRPGAVELLRLRWDAVRWDRRRILVVSADKGGPEAREVPIHEELLPKLKAWWKADKTDSQDFIIHFNGHPIKSIRKAWWTTLERAGFRVRGPTARSINRSRAGSGPTTCGTASSPRRWSRGPTSKPYPKWWAVHRAHF